MWVYMRPGSHIIPRIGHKPVENVIYADMKPV